MYHAVQCKVIVKRLWSNITRNMYFVFPVWMHACMFVRFNLEYISLFFFSFFTPFTHCFLLLTFFHRNCPPFTREKKKKKKKTTKTMQWIAAAVYRYSIRMPNLLLWGILLQSHFCRSICIVILQRCSNSRRRKRRSKTL